MITLCLRGKFEFYIWLISKKTHTHYGLFIKVSGLIIIDTSFGILEKNQNDYYSIRVFSISLFRYTVFFCIYNVKSNLIWNKTFTTFYVYFSQHLYTPLYLSFCACSTWYKFILFFCYSTLCVYISCIFILTKHYVFFFSFFFSRFCAWQTPYSSRDVRRKLYHLWVFMLCKNQ